MVCRRRLIIVGENGKNPFLLRFVAIHEREVRVHCVIVILQGALLFQKQEYLKRTYKEKGMSMLVTPIGPQTSLRVCLW